MVTQSTEVSDITAIASAKTVDVKAGTGISMVDGALTQSNDGSIRYEATTGDITLGELSTGTMDTTIGKVAVIATTGDILDLETDTSTVDITASDLLMTAGKGIAASDNHLETRVLNLTAKAGSGSIYLDETNGVKVRDVSLTVERVNDDGTTTTTSPADSQEDLTTLAGTGNIVLNSATGNIVITDATDENVLGVTATGSSANILLNAAAGAVDIQTGVMSANGNISINASSMVTQSTEVSDITALATGKTIDVKAGTGISMVDGALTQSNNGNIRYEATTGDIMLGELSTGIADTTTGKVAVIATTGDILDLAEDSSTVDITASDLLMTAGKGIAESANHLETRVLNLTSMANDGSIYLDETNGVTVKEVSLMVERVNNNGTTTTTLPADSQEDLTSLAGTGNIVLNSATGNIVITDASDANALGVSATGSSANILLNAAAGAVDIQTGVTSANGNISINAGTTASQSTAAADITASATGKTVDVKAGTGISMVDGALTQSNNGNIRYEATTGDITLEELNAGTRDVSVTATNGSITESGSDSEADIIGNTLNLAVTGTTSTIGTEANTLEINAVNLNASTSGGNIYLNDIVGGVAVGLVTTGGTTSGTVNLMATNGSLLEWGSDLEADIVGETLNLVVTGPTSTIGRAENVLEVDAGSNTLNAKTSGGNIYLNEILGDASIGLIDAGGKEGGQVYLIVTDGGITESGDDPEADIVGKSVILVVNEKKGAPVGDPENMIEISSPELNIENPEGNTYVDLNGTAGSLQFNELPEGMIIDRAHLPALIVFNSRIIGGDQIDGLLHAETTLGVYQFQMQQPLIFRDLPLPSQILPAGDDDHELSLVNNVIK